MKIFFSFFFFFTLVQEMDKTLILTQFSGKFPASLKKRKAIHFSGIRIRLSDNV